ncbi:S-adenosyl-l-methionine hydroxide adenosyltransferase family protein [Planctomyces sp. SH-PL62]|uniref:SAM hydrolase/SAM-dependent halogenase family protein n=1 Tax=Planctomyces sp. SH-PL62 TaxID=1636152 RepID=UPI00078D1086|nr:SAM-dependent chlorinase/fluorinase [Planctomyces sp. SH-PL62]AMV39947.1 Adenosyl-chloride synthase [Planctomyces sp. SH-PL62]
MKPGIVTLTTDFGPEGPYVAAMKGIMLGLAPGVTLVDVCHAIAPQNVLEGAFVLSAIVDAFPPDTVHLAVVDPGVGTARRLLAIKAAGQWFTLPDNGLITGVARTHEIEGAWEISNPGLARRQVSPTFHGRDVLAPAAAHLMKGGDPGELGAATSRFITIRNFEASADGQVCIGEVIFKDAFGNLITNIKEDQMAARPAGSWTVEVGGRRIDGVGRTYAESASGSLIALIGSGGWLEVAVVNGDAGRLLSAGPGTTVWLRPKT